MNKILLATDGSENSIKAMRFASELAGRYKSKLYILHVVPKMEIPESVLKYMATEEIKEPVDSVYLELLGRRIVEMCDSECRAQKDAATETLVLSGDPASQIVKTAKEIGAEAIVMGSRGAGGLVARLLGSVTRKVLDTAEQTCIIVK